MRTSRRYGMRERPINPYGLARANQVLVEAAQAAVRYDPEFRREYLHRFDVLEGQALSERPPCAFCASFVLLESPMLHTAA
jgi:hypothetical protein